MRSFTKIVTRRSVLFLSTLTTLCVASSADAAPVRWQQQRVEVVVDASLEAAGLHGTPVALSAGMAWAAASQGIPDLVLTTGSAGDIGYTPGAKNENSIRFAPQGTPVAKGALAVTVRTYNKKNGAMLDADIVINGEHKFRKLQGEAPQNKNAPNAYDLQNTMTHELGHFLGLGEDFDHEHATMYAYTEPGEVKKRVPSPEDLNQLLSLYDAEGEDADAGAAGCAIAPGNTSGTGFVLLGLGMFGFFAVARRRKRVGTSAALAGGVLLLALPSLADAPIRSVGLAFEAQLRITSVSSHFEGGIVVSELGLANEECVGECSDVPTTIKAYGGSVGEIAQIVGHVATPVVGERVAMRATDTGESGREFEVAPLSVAAAQQKARSSKWQQQQRNNKK